MKDERTLAFLNLYAILGCLPLLCELDTEAQSLISDKNISLGLAIKDGRAATLRFSHGKCSIEQQLTDCDIKLPFSTYAKFNGMINGTVTPIPSKGFTKISFLTKQFTQLTDILSAYLQPEEGKPQNADFLRTRTLLMFHLITEAIAQLGNEDAISRSSASYITDGAIKLSIAGGPSAAIVARNHHLSALHAEPESYTAYMEFCDLDLALQLFEGQVNSVACVGMGQVRIGGMISQVDNLNRILDRVAMYLG